MKKSIILLSALFIMMGVNSSCKKTTVQSADNKVGPSDFLSQGKYTNLIIEVNYVNGYQPTDESLNNLVAFLKQRINKPNGVGVIKKAISVSNTGSYYNLSQVQDIEYANRKMITTGSTLTAYIVYLDKPYEGSASSQGKVLGINYQNSSIVMFENTIAQFSGGVTQPSRSLLETTVVEHEFGHVLGLVNNGTGMQTAHQDTQNGKHCNNTACLMYYAVETSDVVQNLLGSSPPDLDANCLNDLRSAGGK
ncbi:MAG TPA: peptidase [Bacteroidia bacterium]|nr:peptidase [Bacteroidia bacterium]